MCINVQRGTLRLIFSYLQLPERSAKREPMTECGGNYQNVSAAWQYSWLGKPQ